MKRKSKFPITIIFLITGIYSCTYGQETGTLTDQRDGKYPGKGIMNSRFNLIKNQNLSASEIKLIKTGPILKTE